MTQREVGESAEDIWPFVEMGRKHIEQPERNDGVTDLDEEERSGTTKGGSGIYLVV